MTYAFGHASLAERYQKTALKKCGIWGLQIITLRPRGRLSRTAHGMCGTAYIRVRVFALRATDGKLVPWQTVAISRVADQKQAYSGSGAEVTAYVYQLSILI